MRTPPATLAVHCASEEDTAALARALAVVAQPGDLVALEGPLGAGKTVFVRALCEALGVPPAAGVRSPTYALVHRYDGGRLAVAHLDLYRLGGADELEAIGYRDLLDGDCLILVEWADRVADVGADADVIVRFADVGPTARDVTFEVADAALASELALALSTSGVRSTSGALSTSGPSASSIEYRSVPEPSQAPEAPRGAETGVSAPEQPGPD